MIGPKAKNFIKVDLPAEVKDISAMLELIKNKKNYQKYIDEIIALTEKANRSIETLAKAEEIEGMHDTLTSKIEQADIQLTKAKDKAAGLVSDAESKAKRILTATMSEADEINEKAVIKLKSALSKQERADRSMEEAKSITATADALNEQVNKRLEAVQTAEVEINRKKDLLSKL